MSSLFKKSNRRSQNRSNQRTRMDSESEDDTRNHSTNGDINGLRQKNNNENSVKISDNDLNKDSDVIPKPKSNPKLSFDVEEEGDVFKVRKSSYSRRLAKQTENKTKKKDIKKEIKKEKIEDEDNNNNSYDKTYDKNKNDLNVVWIKSKEIKEETIEEKPKEATKIFAGDQIESESEYEEEEEYRSNEPFHHFRGALERGVIPDAKTIYELKKQRQMARDIDDLIIPINEEDRYEEQMIGSRMVRDDDNDKSDDDDEDDKRICFSINQKELERVKNREAFLIAQEENDNPSSRSGSESDDELDRWEREQIKKGVRMPVVQILTQEQASSRAISGLFIDDTRVMDMDIDRPNRHKKSNSIPSKILNQTKSSITMDDILERVRNKLTEIKSYTEGNERQLNTMTVEADQLRDRLRQLSQKREELTNRSTQITRDQMI
ncbi:PAX3- and PAX7-binding protein 1-like [Oppia nitens]|uniref:PAX3- and PAX7-binding protein 1-like n=1 Tax=Oppia nitens TaxID=1686743 RepID=UPI0023DAC91C|nr:PAX3- and PAX7-binding protein 1-like [Oppia nitens]